jgi:non-ribosomal peptide synthetase component E (peptide arylation enzyme)
MIYQLNILTSEITVVSSEAARSALRTAGWSDWNITDMFRSTKVLRTDSFAYCRFSDRLEDERRDKAIAQLAKSLAVRGLSMREVQA